ncbi:uncharacterized protein LOC131024221 [Salvia miltiorrhiza]|uniref:uncharacterized protein LOC131024221 n=1 Tax=Salvia miltiorrhiza TaxID=226208 RepID=UPI0025AD9BEC|nr:uncharacterized protein LOC131024221 [Salvia miltiorrhiza]XP_057809723.1 uncharacterized protein LOC131024221 [Salvia miltiorrhiza]XP_057809730.1 uncharacterized protein LOC131024221 [Salvia miltiorrhiza]XP_057809738.1 uncharacterized protein LOC131024221 [Salvia miltiorrhiza]
MKLVRSALWSANAVLSHQFQSPRVVRAFSASASPVSDDWDRVNSSDFFGDSQQGNSGDVNSSRMTSFYGKLGKLEKAAHDAYGMGGVFGDNMNSLADGMDYKLKKAATYFEFDPFEVTRDDYTFRPDVNFQSGMSYETKDLDLRKPGVRKPSKRMEFVTTTKEVLREADFRNVKFLAKFITEAGIIDKRSKTGISAKAQRKVAREIKTARAFGLMPFTTMGTKQFKYGDTMEAMDRDFEFEPSYDHTFVEEGADA